MSQPAQSETVQDRVIEAYLRMATDAKYRPAAPGDGMGGISLSTEELADKEHLQAEANYYFKNFLKEAATQRFHIGISKWPTNRALVYTIEAARLLCGGISDSVALKLLRMAADELDSVIHGD